MLYILILFILFLPMIANSMDAPQVKSQLVNYLQASLDAEYSVFESFTTDLKKQEGSKLVPGGTVEWVLKIALPNKYGETLQPGTLYDALIVQSNDASKKYRIVVYKPIGSQKTLMEYSEKCEAVGPNYWAKREKSLVMLPALKGLLMGWGTAIQIDQKRIELDTQKIFQNKEIDGKLYYSPFAQHKDNL